MKELKESIPLTSFTDEHQHQCETSKTSSAKSSKTNTTTPIEVSNLAKTTMYQRLNDILDRSEAQFTCSVCSDIMNHPATVACGHTFCTGCIQDWFQNKENCPCCRESCHGGEHSDPVVPIVNFSKIVKPLIYYRQNAPLDISPPEPKFTIEQDEKLLNYLSNRILSVKTELDYRNLDAGLKFVRNAISTGTSLDEIIQDCAHLTDSTRHLKTTIEKYFKHESLSDENYFYEPMDRKRKITFNWPTYRSMIQICIVGFLSFLAYHALDGLEQEGFAMLAEPLLRSISLLDVYIGLFEYFR